MIEVDGNGGVWLELLCKHGSERHISRHHLPLPPRSAMDALTDARMLDSAERRV